MIKIKNLANDFEHTISPTFFPDGTSQIWKLPAELFHYKFSRNEFHVTWYFESEAELFQLIQLRYLISNSKSDYIKTMFIPFLPYSRQDKEIKNENTFALSPFLHLLSDYFSGVSITTLDVHNKEAYNLKERIDSLSPAKYILKSLIHSQADLVCYPDAGAQARYNHLIPMDHVIADKVRDQATGKITGHKLIDTGKVSSQDMIQGKTILIVDDIADGSMTFISMAKMLLSAGATKVDLYVTHGIFSKGLHIVHEAGIKRVYTTDSIQFRSSMTDALLTKVYEVEEN